MATLTDSSTPRPESVRAHYNTVMDVSHLLDGLNPAQREAVSAPIGHYLVLAGAGSGKTRVLTHRIAWLLEVEGASPWSILAVTFTNKAAGEMRARCDSLIRQGTRGLTIGTFHGIAHRLLRQHWREAKLPETFQILDSDDQQRMIKRVMQGLGIDDSRFPPRQAAWFINTAKDEGKRPEAFQGESNPLTRTLIDIYKAYEEACQRSGVVDFAELLLRSHELWLKDEALLAHYRERYRHLLVDEFQDTNTIQYAWIRVLAGQTGKVFVVGDDDQAIYGWRGARVENVQHFLRDFPGAKTIRLEQNYRSTGTILKAANAIIANNPQRLGKKLWTAGEAGAPISLYAAYNEQDEARFVIERIREHVQQGGKASECAILYRSNAQSRNFEEQLIQHDIRYRVYGGLRFFDRAEIKDALAYLRLVANRHDDPAFERTINTPTRGIGERTLDALRQRARRDNVALWDAALAELQDSGLAGRAKNALRGFMLLIEELAKACMSQSDAPMALAEQIDHAIQRSGLRDFYEADSRGSAESRVENLDELVNVASRFERTAEDIEAGILRTYRVPRARGARSGRIARRSVGRLRAIDDAALGQRSGILARVSGRSRRRIISQPAIAGRTGPPRRRTPSRIRRRHARARHADSFLRRIATLARCRNLQSSVAIPARVAARTAQRSASARAGFAADVRGSLGAADLGRSAGDQARSACAPFEFRRRRRCGRGRRRRACAGAGEFRIGRREMACRRLCESHADLNRCRRILSPIRPRDFTCPLFSARFCSPASPLPR